MKALLELRNTIKSKKPDFIRQDAHKKVKLKEKWRRPKGIHSKMRLKRKGHRKSVSVGYGSPRAVRGLSRDGLKEVLIENINQLSSLKSGEGIVLSGKLGTKKKIELLKKIKELKLKILNVKNIDEFLNKVDDIIKKKKVEEKKRGEEKKEEKKEESKEDKEKIEKKKILEKKKIGKD